MALEIESFALTDTGLVRHNNEDCFGKVDEIPFFVLADGMGGHRAGEVASAEAVSALTNLVKERFSGTDPYEIGEMLRHAIVDTNAIVYSISSSEPDFRGMGTTICCLLPTPEGVVYAHVGDSRIYLFREGKLDQLTNDHTLVTQLVDSGHIEAHRAGEFAYKNILTRSIGCDPIVEPDVEIQTVVNGDIYLLCSDGLTDMLSHSEIEASLQAAGSVEEKANLLVAEANRRGGIDNITVIVVKCLEKNIS